MTAVIHFYTWYPSGRLCFTIRIRLGLILYVFHSHDLETFASHLGRLTGGVISTGGQRMSKIGGRELY